ncbi:MAG: histidine--tRNA ligase, partial [Candidatus Omnitrophica bacterium]|nr:histidine--tRNA ligase [Candidatus Omnitrophota bacterium]
GMERMILALGGQALPQTENPLVYLVALDEASLAEMFVVLDQARAAGIPADMSYKLASMKSLMRAADKSGAVFVGIMGENERAVGQVSVKNLKTGDQGLIAKPALVDFLLGAKM